MLKSEKGNAECVRQESETLKASNRYFICSCFWLDTFDRSHKKNSITFCCCCCCCCTYIVLMYDLQLSLSIQYICLIFIGNCFHTLKRARRKMETQKSKMMKNGSLNEGDEKICDVNELICIRWLNK